MAFINVGYGNIVNTEKIISVINYEAAPIKRMVQTAKDAVPCHRCYLRQKNKSCHCYGKPYDRVKFAITGYDHKSIK